MKRSGNNDMVCMIGMSGWWKGEGDEGWEGWEGREGRDLLSADYFAIAFESLTELSTSLGQPVSQGLDFCGPHGYFKENNSLAGI